MHHIAFTTRTHTQTYKQSHYADTVLGSKRERVEKTSTSKQTNKPANQQKKRDEHDVLHKRKIDDDTTTTDRFEKYRI